MKLLHKILVPVDFSDSSINAVRHAIYLAKSFNSRITLLHVVSENIDFMEDSSQLEIIVNGKLREVGKLIHAEGVKLEESVIEYGIPFERIIDFSIRSNINLIIAGVGFKEKHETYKLGTTVQKLMRKNVIPLWVVKNEGLQPIRSIICPVDFSEASKRALSNAIMIARKFDAELNVLNVYSPLFTYSFPIELDNSKENEELFQKKKKEFYSFLEEFNLSSVRHNIQILSGEPYLEIIKKIKTEYFDLLIMGTTGRTGISKLLIGSVTEKVTREFPCNFIVTKTKDISEEFLESNLKGIESAIKTAKHFYDLEQYDIAIEKYTMALQHYPDNIPILIGLIKSHKAEGNMQKARYYKDFAVDLIKRIWGEEYIEKIGVNNL